MCANYVVYKPLKPPAGSKSLKYVLLRISYTVPSPIHTQFEAYMKTKAQPACHETIERKGGV